MSGQVLELIIFAAIAFIVINRLISILGTDSEDAKNRSSFFGETGVAKDVTPKNQTAKILKPNFVTKKIFDLKGLIIEENAKDIQDGLLDILSKYPSFNPKNFLKGAKIAFSMIIEAYKKNKESELSELVDKRYIDNFIKSADSYGDITDKKEKLEAYIAEAYSFGNNIFVKILFTGENITSKIVNLSEEWTFCKSTIDSKPSWQLSNIERSH